MTPESSQRNARDRFFVSNQNSTTEHAEIVKNSSFCLKFWFFHVFPGKVAILNKTTTHS